MPDQKVITFAGSLDGCRVVVNIRFDFIIRIDEVYTCDWRKLFVILVGIDHSYILVQSVQYSPVFHVNVTTAILGGTFWNGAFIDLISDPFQELILNTWTPKVHG